VGVRTLVPLVALASVGCAPHYLDRDVRTVAVLMPDDQSLSKSGDAGRAGFLWRVLTFRVGTLRESRHKAVAECFRKLPRPRPAP